MKDIQHGHITRAFDKDGVTECICCGRAILRGDFPQFCRERDMQEFMLRGPAQASALREERIVDTEETARNKPKAREKMSERMRRVDEGKRAKSIWDLLENNQKRGFGVKEGEQERGWSPRDDHSPMEKDGKYSGLAPASADERTLRKETIVGEERSDDAASSVLTMSRVSCRRSRRLSVRKL